MTQKTNAMRVLDQRGIPYRPITYAPEIHGGESVAIAIGEPIGRVFKTLVVLRDRGSPLLIVIPTDRELDLKLCAVGVGEKRVRMASQREAEDLTGLQVGGISALALLGKGFAVYLDRAAERWDQICVSGGQRGLTLRIRPSDFIRVTDAHWIELGSDLHPS